jgi:hypothetical protein
VPIDGKVTANAIDLSESEDDEDDEEMEDITNNFSVDIDETMVRLHLSMSATPSHKSRIHPSLKTESTSFNFHLRSQLSPRKPIPTPFILHLPTNNLLLPQP